MRWLHNDELLVDHVGKNAEWSRVGEAIFVGVASEVGDGEENGEYGDGNAIDEEKKTDRFSDDDDEEILPDESQELLNK
jgi:hypothetical protein